MVFSSMPFSSMIPRVQRRKEDDEDEPQSPSSLRKSHSFVDGSIAMGTQASRARHVKNNAIIHNRNYQCDIDCDDRHTSFKVEYYPDWAEQAKIDVQHFMVDNRITAQSHIFHVVDCHGAPYDHRSGDAEDVFPLRFVFRRKAY
jgi:hypothetical protein